MDHNGNNISEAFLYWTRAFLLTVKDEDVDAHSAHIANQLRVLPKEHQARLKKALDGFGKVMFAK